jgi:uncharacterized protein
MLKVQLACAEAEDVMLLTLQVAEGATVKDAVEQSGLRNRCPQLFPVTGSIGIFGKLCTEATLLQDGDRIEIYRPLRADPKEARRSRASRRGKSAT